MLAHVRYVGNLDQAGSAFSRGRIVPTEQVVVTGTGVVTAAGSSVERFWEALLAGASTARYVERVDMSGSQIGFACEVADFDPTSLLSEKETRRHDRITQLTLGAAHAALTDAGSPSVDGDRVAVVIGTGFGGLETAEANARDFLGVGTPGVQGRTHPLFIPMAMPNAPAAAVSMRWGFRGPCLNVATACAAGANAIGEGVRLLQQGAADVVVAGGAEAPIVPWIMAGFAAARALSQRSDDPAGASRPFDRDRDGFVMGEGAAVLVLERAGDARSRGAPVRGQVLGYARNADAFHLVAPPPDGRGAADCMRLALDDAGIAPSDVAHVNAHGTSTLHNDLAEAIAIRTVFGASPPPVTSVKGVIGHSIGAAGAIEAAATLLTLEHATIPPTANLATLDPEIDLDVVTTPRPLGDGMIVSSSFAFGGHNAVLVLGRA
jgi:3-oxoacyl-[acyl-carrier-protein] synthase II